MNQRCRRSAPENRSLSLQSPNVTRRSEISQQIRFASLPEIRNWRQFRQSRGRYPNDKTDIRFAEIESAVLPRRNKNPRLPVHIDIGGTRNRKERNLLSG